MDTKKIYDIFIKYYKQIHLIILLLCSYICYKTINLILFIKELTTKDYNKYITPISNYIKPEVFITILFILIISVLLITLLKQNNKKTKLYNLVIFEYIALAPIIKMIQIFFNNYFITKTSNVLTIILITLLTLLIPQCLILLITILRTFGVGIKNFTDTKQEKTKKVQEQESIEDMVARKNREKRYKEYFYKENKLKIRNIIIKTILILIIVISLYVFVINKSYKEKELITINDYDITINEAYYTDKDYEGNTISNKYAFIILDVTIKNKFDTRKVDLDYFHIVNKNNDYITTYNLYKKQFQDLGQTYDNKILTKNQKFDQIIVFKVDKSLKLKDFKLYYQEFIHKEPFKRKIDITIEDISTKQREFNEDQTIENNNNFNNESEQTKEPAVEIPEENTKPVNPEEPGEKPIEECNGTTCDEPIENNP